MENPFTLTQLLGFGLALVSGTLMGLMGSGGAILAVPIFVYIFAVPATDATTLSLVVVSVSSLYGFFAYAKNKNFSFRSSIAFGIPLLISMFVVRQMLIPMIPKVIFGFTVDNLILLGFAGLMLLAAVLIFFPVNHVPIRHKNRLGILIGWIQSAGQGGIVGGISGLLGAGGGFMIVPALVRFQGIPFRKATGTSLFLIFLNSTTGWVIDLVQHRPFHPNLLIPYSAIMLLGTFLGAKWSQKVPVDSLRKGFALLLILVATFVICERLFLK